MRQVKEMSKPTQSTRQRLLERQSARYVDELELPFSMPPAKAAVDDGPLVDARLGDGEQPARRDGAVRDPHDHLNTVQG